MRIPIDIIYGSPQGEPVSKIEFTRQLKSNLEIAFRNTRNNLECAHKRQKEYYDRKIKGQQFSVGESVWLHNQAIKKGEYPKFHNPWVGQFKVQEKLSDVTYKIFSEDGKTRKVVHFDRLKRAFLPKETEVKDEATASDASSESDVEVQQPVLKKKIHLILKSSCRCSTLPIKDQLYNEKFCKKKRWPKN